MRKSLSKAIDAPTPPGIPLTGLACRIVQVSPLLIDFYGTTTYPALKTTTAVVTVGPAIAIMFPGSKPIIIQTGA